MLFVSTVCSLLLIVYKTVSRILLFISLLYSLLLMVCETVSSIYKNSKLMFCLSFTFVCLNSIFITIIRHYLLVRDYILL